MKVMITVMTLIFPFLDGDVPRRASYVWRKHFATY